MLVLMNTLYLIGNGFDIQHGLKTQYKYFRQYIESIDESFLMEFEKIYDIYPPNTDEPYYKDPDRTLKEWNERIENVFWWNFEKQLGYPNDSEMYDYSVCAAEGLDEKYPAILVESTMKSYMKDQYGFVTRLQKYLYQWINTISLDSVHPCRQTLVNSNDKFLTFNYTGVLEEVYGISSERILHIHGALEKYSSTKPIIGHGNTHDIQKYRKLAEEERSYPKAGSTTAILNAIADYYENTVKDTRKLIENNEAFFCTLNHVKNVIVIGMSLNEVDLPYLFKVKRSIRRDAEWQIFYHGSAPSPEQIQAERKLHLQNRQKEKVFHPDTEFWD